MAIEVRDIDKVCDHCGAVAKVEIVDTERGSLGFYCREHARKRLRAAGAPVYKSLFDWLRAKP